MEECAHISFKYSTCNTLNCHLRHELQIESVLRNFPSMSILGSMNSLFFVLLLIVNQLTCPLRCLAYESHAASSGESSRATCDCCAHSEQAPESDTSEPHEEGCSCRSCICDGAVFEHAVELSDPGPTLSWLLPLHLKLSQAAALAETAPSSAFMLGGRIHSGRDARIAHQSWQI